jgi:hypothetical protein
MIDRTRSKIPAPARKGTGGVRKVKVSRSCDLRAAKSSQRALGCELRVLAPGDRLELDGHASVDSDF